MQLLIFSQKQSLRDVLHISFSDLTTIQQFTRRVISARIFGQTPLPFEKPETTKIVTNFEFSKLAYLSNSVKEIP